MKSSLIKILSSASLVMIAHSALGLTINFEEFAADNTNGAMPANRYAAWDITFVATDDGTTWGGIGNGDPGNWDIEGTNGSIFSGFNGQSSGLTTLWGSAVENFSLDVSRSLGSSAGQLFTLEGYLNNILVDSVTVTLGGINSWTNVSLNGAIDESRWIGQQGFNPFGVDNLNWDVANRVPDSAATLQLLSVALLFSAFIRRKIKNESARI